MLTIHHQISIPRNVVMKPCAQEQRLVKLRSISFRRKMAVAILYKSEFALMGMESDPTEEKTFIICDGGATPALTSSFENCTDCKPRKVNINLAEGGVAMVTTHEVTLYCTQSPRAEVTKLLCPHH